MSAAGAPAPALKKEPEAKPGRTITLVLRNGAATPASIPIEIDRARTYRLLCSREARVECIAQLVDSGHAAVVSPGGGLLGNLPVWENIVLPVAWRMPAPDADVDARLRAFFAHFGFRDERLRGLCRAMPERLSPFEERLVAFARAMLLEPEVMVYDRLFEALTRHETEQALRFDALFRVRFPFRTSVFLDGEIAPLVQIGAHEAYDIR